ncbi:hypothetical protein LTR16_004554 [Cryomyces antarcticus]|uniref:SLC26A/SulP transporter domain-containing protein n=1 Tax=Cryomyces antarcticus TaxID=329879 RepID=A0ABR0M6G5_9PEZI|nr:hypothetical protein LTR16_004554 [Cryomyces antarcticus]
MPSTGSKSPTAPSSPQVSPAPSRSSSISYPKGQQHAPLNPSHLRESHMPPSSPENRTVMTGSLEEGSRDTSTSTHHPKVDSQGIHPTASGHVSPTTEATPVQTDGTIEDPIDYGVRTRLLGQQHWDSGSGCGSDNCAHGTFSPRPQTHRSYGSTATFDGFGGKYGGGIGEAVGSSGDNGHSGFGDVAANAMLGEGQGHRMSTTQYLAKRHGIKNTRLMYIVYYFPFTRWITQYKWSYLQGDLIAALTMASFYIPMSLSYASNLAHIPPINGLYSFAFNPFIYALLGTCPQMVVGPEAAGSLLTGQVVRENINNGNHQDQDGTKNAQIAGMVTGLAGAVILMAGLFRLGFLDSVLSRPFLRGFISAIGIVILVDQLIPEMGLSAVAAHVGGAAHGSSLDKIIFLCKNGAQAHGLTCAVSFGSFAIIMVLRSAY